MSNNVNYTDDERIYIVAEYEKDPCRDTVEKLAEELNKSAKSIIGKLSREGVYRRESYTTKVGEKPVTKLELVVIVADVLHLRVEDLEGLDKAPKGVLKVLCTGRTSS
tara:strand:- start:50 stop:373 length:324 start_codon:yes stop_codon:yes gene_type:complete